MPTGIVKFFNYTRGFGFIIPDDGAPDVFVDKVALQRSGLSVLNDDDHVSFELQRDAKTGRTSAGRLDVISSPAGDRPDILGRSNSQGLGENGPRQRPENGVVRWFDPTVGYGFIQSSSGGEVFVHIAAVRRAGLHELKEGQSLSYVIERDERTCRTMAGDLTVETSTTTVGRMD